MKKSFRRFLGAACIGVAGLAILLSFRAGSERRAESAGKGRTLDGKDSLGEREFGQILAVSNFSAPAEREDIPAGSQILLHTRRVVDKGEKPAASTLRFRNTLTRLRASLPLVVHFRTPVSRGIREKVRTCGGTVLSYLPHRALLVDSSRATIDRLRSLPEVSTYFELLPFDKIHPALAEAISRYPDRRVNVTILPLLEEDLPLIAGKVNALGGTLHDREGALRAVMPLSSLRALLEMGEVRWIEAYRRPRLLSDVAHGEGILDTRSLWEKWLLTGEGEIVGHSDTGIDTGMPISHPDLSPAVLKIIRTHPEADGSDRNGHGTHTAGLLVGRGNRSGGKYRGSAFGAKMVHHAFYTDGDGYLYGVPANLYPFFDQDYRLGARVHSISWGSPSLDAGYGAQALAVDRFVWDHPDYLPVLAAGNSGDDNDRNGVVDPRSIMEQGLAKNVLTVGASESHRPPSSSPVCLSENYYQYGFDMMPFAWDRISFPNDQTNRGLCAFSSRGPAKDGRIKPDLVAPGSNIASTRSSLSRYLATRAVPGFKEDYLFMSGTSMATPLVAGGALLMREYCRKRGKIENPSSALVRAMMLNGARTLAPGQYGTGVYREIPPVSPNSAEGWGEADFGRSLHPEGEMIRLIDSISLENGQTNRYPVEVVRPGPLSITLAWIDYPASPSAAKTLVNDYDLEVVSPDGTIFYPNGLGKADRTNPTERILIENAGTGRYEVRVIAHECPYGSEEGGSVALALRGGLGESPVIVHDPPRWKCDSGEPLDLLFRIQSLSPLTNDLSAVWLKFRPEKEGGTTGAWQRVRGEWISNTLYRARCSLPPSPSWYAYRFEASENGISGESAVYRIYVNTPSSVVVDGLPERYGEPIPDYGTLSIPSGLSMDFEAPATVPLSDGVRMRCNGFVGTGDFPYFGTTNRATSLCRQDSTLSWVWGRQYRLVQKGRLTRAGGSVRSVLLDESWWDEGERSDPLYMPETLDLGEEGKFAFAGWVLDSQRFPENPRAFLMETPLEVFADYIDVEIDRDGDGFPDWWTLRYGAGERVIDPDADDDQDGWSNWQECLDHTDPWSPESVPQPPALLLEELEPFQTNFPPWKVKALVLDNGEVDEVFLLWREEGDTEWSRTRMVQSTESTLLYEGLLLPEYRGGKSVEYRVEAVDRLAREYPGRMEAAYTPSAYVAGRYPCGWIDLESAPGTRFDFTARQGKEPQRFILRNLAGPACEWRALWAGEPLLRLSPGDPGWRVRGGGWVRSDHRSEDGEPVWYCGDPGTHRYSDNMWAELETPSFKVPANPLLSVRHWIKSELEPSAPGKAWDAAILTLSADGGSTWEVLSPMGGYPYEIFGQSNASVLKPGEPCLAGDGSLGWQTLWIDLERWQGRTVSLRLCFASDAATVDEGWYVGDCSLFSCTEDLPFLHPTGDASGRLPRLESLTLDYCLDLSLLDPHRLYTALLWIKATGVSPLCRSDLPLQWRLGNSLTLERVGKGRLEASSLFLFGEENASTVTARADTYHHLAALFCEGGASFSLLTNTPLMTLTLRNLREDTRLTARFGENLLDHGVPEWWMASFGLTNGMSRLLESDLDGDGLLTWEEFWSDTSPVDLLSVLRFISLSRDVLTWTGGTRRNQSLLYAETLEGPWRVIHTRKAPTSVTNSFPIPSSLRGGFFRISVPDGGGQASPDVHD